MELETNKQYDEIVGTIIQNVLSQSNFSKGTIVLWDFQLSVSIDRLYYNVACIVADMFDKQIYLQMPFFEYIKFKYKRRKRKNLHWISRKADWISIEAKTSVYIIMDYVREFYDINVQVFEDINNEYYGWIE